MKKELEQKKSELVNEKSRNNARLAEVNALLNTGGGPRQTLLRERGEIVADNTEVDSELREINRQLRELNSAEDGQEKSLYAIVMLVSARIAAGSPNTVAVLTKQAKADLATIRANI